MPLSKSRYNHRCMSKVVYGRLNDPVAYDQNFELSDEELKEKARSNLDIDNFNDEYFDFEVLETEDKEVRYVMLCTLIRGVGPTFPKAEEHLKERFTNGAQPADHRPALIISELDAFKHLIGSYTIEEEVSGHLAHEI